VIFVYFVVKEQSNDFLRLLWGYVGVFEFDVFQQQRGVGLKIKMGAPARRAPRTIHIKRKDGSAMGALCLQRDMANLQPHAFARRAPTDALKGKPHRFIIDRIELAAGDPRRRRTRAAEPLGLFRNRLQNAFGYRHLVHQQILGNSRP